MLVVLLDRLAQVNDRTKEPTNFRVLLTLVGKRGQVGHGSLQLALIVIVDGHWILLQSLRQSMVADAVPYKKVEVVSN